MTVRHWRGTMRRYTMRGYKQGYTRVHIEQIDASLTERGELAAALVVDSCEPGRHSRRGRCGLVVERLAY